MSERKLLPCPFCGGEAAVNTAQTSDAEMIRLNGRDHGFGVNCVACGVNNREIWIGKATREAAIEAWNTRAEITCHAALLAAAPEPPADPRDAEVAALRDAVFNADAKLADRDAEIARLKQMVTERDKWLAQQGINLAETQAEVERLTTMLVRAHAEGFLSEGQAAKATGLHRVELRRRVDVILASNGTATLRGEVE